MKRNLTYIPNVNVKAEEQVESLRRLVAKKKANDEKIPKELLRTQYKNPYEKLLKEIRDCAGNLCFSFRDNQLIFRTRNPNMFFLVY